MSLEKKCSEKILQEEYRFQVSARYARNKLGRCPALRYNEKGEAYCSRLLPCEEYAADDFVRDLEVGICSRDYVRCRYIEKISSRQLPKKEEQCR